MIARKLAIIFQLADSIPLYRPPHSCKSLSVHLPRPQTTREHPFGLFAPLSSFLILFHLLCFLEAVRAWPHTCPCVIVFVARSANGEVAAPSFNSTAAPPNHLSSIFSIIFNNQSPPFILTFQLKIIVKAGLRSLSHSLLLSFYTCSYRHFSSFSFLVHFHAWLIIRSRLLSGPVRFFLSCFVTFLPPAAFHLSTFAPSPHTHTLVILSFLRSISFCWSFIRLSVPGLGTSFAQTCDYQAELFKSPFWFFCVSLPTHWSFSFFNFSIFFAFLLWSQQLLCRFRKKSALLRTARRQPSGTKNFNTWFCASLDSRRQFCTC